MASALVSSEGPLSSLSFLPVDLEDASFLTPAQSDQHPYQHRQQLLQLAHGQQQAQQQAHAKLFVGNIPRTIKEPEVRAMFEEVGLLSVVEVALLRDRATGQQQTCCFVKVPTLEEAEVAIKVLNNKRHLPGGPAAVQVRLADGERERLGAVEFKLFVGSVSRTAGDADLRAIFSKFGSVEDVYIMRDQDKKSRGCAFVKLATKEGADAAIAALHGLYRMEGMDHPLTVRYADSKRPKSELLRNSNSGNSASPGHSASFSARPGQLPGVRSSPSRWQSHSHSNFQQSQQQQQQQQFPLPGFSNERNGFQSMPQAEASPLVYAASLYPTLSSSRTSQPPFQSLGPDAAPGALAGMRPQPSSGNSFGKLPAAGCARAAVAADLPEDLAFTQAYTGAEANVHANANGAEPAPPVPSHLAIRQAHGQQLVQNGDAARVPDDSPETWVIGSGLTQPAGPAHLQVGSEQDIGMIEREQHTMDNLQLLGQPAGTLGLASTQGCSMGDPLWLQAQQQVPVQQQGMHGSPVQALAPWGLLPQLQYPSGAGLQFLPGHMQPNGLPVWQTFLETSVKNGSEAMNGLSSTFVAESRQRAMQEPQLALGVLGAVSASAQGGSFPWLPQDS